MPDWPNWKDYIRARLALLRLPPERELEIVEELALHFEAVYEDARAQGLSETEAQSHTIQSYDWHLLECELSRIERPSTLERIEHKKGLRMESLLQDLRFGARMLFKQPGFTLIAVLTLSLGIGANTAIFSLVNAVLLRQLPYRQSEQLVWVWATRTDRDKAFYSVPNFTETRERQQSFAQLAAFANWGVNLTGNGEAERWQGVRLSAHALQMLGVEAAAGRLLQAEDDKSDNARVVVLSYGLWQRHFGSNQNVIGQSLTLNGDAYTVVGVLPPQFTIPNAEIDLATALRAETDPRRGERSSNFLRVFGRLKEGVSVAQAKAELAAITARLREEHPDNNAKLTAPNVLLLQDEITGGYRVALWLLLGAVVLVLLIACANLANLLLARATARQREIAIRAALGATRFRLVRQMLIESLLLAFIGGALGVLLAIVGSKALLSLSPADLPRVSEVNIDGRMLLFSLTLSLLAGLLFGLAPAWQATKTNLNLELKEGGRSGSSGAAGRLRNALVVAEVALSLTLLVGAGLLIKSFTRLQSVNPGFTPDKLLTVRLSLTGTQYAQAAAVQTYYDRLAMRLSSVPEVAAVGAASALPLSAINSRTEFTIVGRPSATRAEWPAAQDRWVSPGYFQTMQIPLRAGREFTAADNERAANVVVIDEALARRYWPDGKALGAHIRLDYGTGEPPREYEIIGVVSDVKHVGLNDEPTPTLYGPLAQVPPSAVTGRLNNLSIVARVTNESQAVAARVRHEVQAVDPQAPASNARMMTQFVASAIAARRFNGLLLSVFAVAALLLAAAGLYAVLSYSVRQRTRELGIRLALGANAAELLRLVIGQGLKLALLGIAVGLVAALALTRAMSGLLFEVSATDPLTYASVALLLTFVALVACWVPARRATKVDPLITLRHE
jgi:putative ABC transport system permease protein